MKEITSGRRERHCDDLRESIRIEATALARDASEMRGMVNEGEILSAASRAHDKALRILRLASKLRCIAFDLDYEP